MSVSYFLVAVQTADNRSVKIGTIANGKRLSCDKRVAEYFPANTRSRKDILSACRWCLDGSKVLPRFVDLEIRNNTYRVIPIKD